MNGLPRGTTALVVGANGLIGEAVAVNHVGSATGRLPWASWTSTSSTGSSV
jgi:hypothetical protein